MVSDEKELHPQNPQIQRFIASELERQKEIADSLSKDRKEDWEKLNQVFLETLGGKIEE